MRMPVIIGQGIIERRQKIREGMEYMVEDHPYGLVDCFLLKSRQESHLDNGGIDMNKQKCVEDLRSIFTKPGEYSAKLEDGESYLLCDFSDNHFVVSKRWGYWMVVVGAMQEYFHQNGSVDNGGGVLVSSNDILGTEIVILDGDEVRSVKEYQKEHGCSDALHAYHQMIKENKK